MAIYRVDFQVYPDECYILLGSSGRGRLTLLKAIGGYLTPIKGETRLKDQPVTKPGSDRVTVFREFDQLLPWKTAKENVLPPLLSTGKLGAREAEERALHYTNKVSLIKFADHHLHMLSGRIKQRVATARGMAMELDMLLMDKPFVVFDALTRRKIQDGSLQLRDEMRFTVLFVTYLIPEAIRCGSRILIPSPHLDQVYAKLPNLARGDDDPKRFKALEAEIHDMLFARAVEETHAD